MSSAALSFLEDREERVRRDAGCEGRRQCARGNPRIDTRLSQSLQYKRITPSNLQFMHLM